MTQVQTVTTDHPDARKRRIVLWILVFLAGIEFVIRGPVRCLETTWWNDLAQYYVSSQLWLRGQNFASPENIVALWGTEVGVKLDPNSIRTHLALPPGALVFFAPFAALSWLAALIAWLLTLLAGFAITVWSLIRAGSLRLTETRTIAFIAACLALAPFHTGIASANQTIVVVGLCAAGIAAAARRHDVSAGILLGIACSLKPHIASFLVLYYLVKLRWRVFLTAVGVTVLLVTIAVGWMRFNGVQWEQDYVNNIRFAAAKNKIDDFTTNNPARFLLINLQVPFYSMTHNVRTSNLLGLGTGSVLLLVWLAYMLKMRAHTAEPLALAAVAVIGLLPFYHRSYDASMLAFPLCWALGSRFGIQKRIAGWALILMAPFLLPTTAILQQLVGSGRVPAVVAQSWWWDCIVMPHQTWLLVALSLTLLYALSSQGPANANHAA